MYKFCTYEILITEKDTLYFKFTVNIQICYTSEGKKVYKVVLYVENKPLF
jgi:hypothetical protein